MKNLIARLRTMKINGVVPGATFGDTKYDSEAVSYGYDLAVNELIGILEKQNTPEKVSDFVRGLYLNGKISHYEECEVAINEYLKNNT